MWSKLRRNGASFGRLLDVAKFTTTEIGYVFCVCSKVNFDSNKRFIQKTVTHLKLALHILCATLIGLMYGDSGSNASKSIENVGFLLIGIAYLWYTTVMPGVLKCKFKSVFWIINGEIREIWRIDQYFSSKWVVYCAQRNFQQLVQSENILFSELLNNNSNSRM